MNETLKRTVWGALFVAIIVFSLIIGDFFPVAILFVFMWIAINEFYSLFKSVKKNFTIIILGNIGAIMLYGGLYFNSMDDSNFNILFLLIPFFLPLSNLVFTASKHPIKETSLVYLSWIYITLPFYIMYEIYNFSINNAQQWQLLLGFFVLIWANDTFAYLGGKKFGKNKLIERISPKKTWEGAVIGFVSTIAIGALYSYLTNQFFLFWIMAAFICSPMAVLGDLIESKLKRVNRIKDSGKFLPGHGGILDRFDASIFAAPFFYLIMLIYF